MSITILKVLAEIRFQLLEKLRSDISEEKRIDNHRRLTMLGEYRKSFSENVIYNFPMPGDGYRDVRGEILDHILKWDDAYRILPKPKELISGLLIYLEDDYPEIVIKSIKAVMNMAKELGPAFYFQEVTKVTTTIEKLVTNNNSRIAKQATDFCNLLKEMSEG